MKKFFITFIAILLPLLASATDINGINYDLNSSTKTATVVQGSYSGYIYIYSHVTYEGVTYTVTSIGENAFRNSDITDVWIPNTVTSIGKCSFGACSSLSSISIPSSVTEIGPAAFYGCSALKNVILPSGLKLIDENLFWGCTSLTSVTIPTGVTSIAEEAFRECIVLPSIIIPSSVTEIGDRAFEDCTSLKKIILDILAPFAIPDNIFNGIPSDATLSVPEGTKTAYQNTAGWNVISDGITEIQTKRTIHVATAGTLPQLISVEKYYIEELTLTGELNGTDFIFIREMAGISMEDHGKDIEETKTDGKLKSLDISEVEIIGGGEPYYIFFDLIDSDREAIGTLSNTISYRLFAYTNLESIVLPNNITRICQGAFAYTKLTSLTIPEKVISIGGDSPGFGGSLGTFAGCANLKTIDIPNSVTTLSSYAFSGSSITSINIPNSVTIIEDHAFSGSSGLTSVTIPNSVTSIGDYAFEGCSGLTSVTIPNSVTSMGYQAFWNCTSLTSVTIPNSITSIGGSTFYNCTGLTSVTIPNSVTSIGRYAFSSCSGLTSVTIPNSVTRIGSDAFYGTAWYNNQPNGLVYAGKVAYEYKGDMPENTSIIIEDGTVGIADYAFSGCSGLTSVTIPNSVTSIGERAFSGCSGLTSVIIPNGVTSIAGAAFSGCSGLTSVTIPNSVTSIGNYAFQDCSLTSITIPNSVTTIGCGAFQNNGSLTTAILGDGITEIASNTFYGCTGLTSVTIPKSVTSIGYKAFYGCSGLTSVDISDLAAWCNIKFGYADSNPLDYAHHLYINGNEIINLVIPNDVTSIGSYAFRGCSGLTSVTIPNSVTSIGDYAFNECSGLTSVTIPSSLTSIGWNAFDGCSGLTSVNISDLAAWCNIKFSGNGSNPLYYARHLYINGNEITNLVIPNSVTSIGSDAFSGCTGLTSVNIPNSVTSIGWNAFDGCSGLTSVTIPNSVTSIAGDAFSGCSGLTSILSLNNTPTTCHSTNSFDSVNKESCVLWVPKGSVNVYKNANVWKDFQIIRGIIDGDVNLDGELNQTDLDATVDYIMDKDPEGFYESLADLNGDDVVDAADVVNLVAILNLQEGLSMENQAKYSNQVISSLSCTLNNDGDKTIQLTKCELYCNQSIVMAISFDVTLASGGNKKCSFDQLASYSTRTGFSLVWYYTYNGEDYIYCCEITE